jgi:hypothetical protein
MQANAYASALTSCLRCHGRPDCGNTGVKGGGTDTLNLLSSQRSRNVQPIIDGCIHALRNLVERCFSKLEHGRRLATRYDKTADSFIGFVPLASIRLWVRHLVNRT